MSERNDEFFDGFPAMGPGRPRRSVALVQVRTPDGNKVGLYSEGGLYHQGNAITFQQLADAADFELIELPVDPQCLVQPGNRLPQDLTDVRVAAR